MNRIVCAITVLFGLFALFIACAKKVDKEEYCRIMEFTYYEKQYSSTAIDTIIAKFTYDQRGNPTSIVFNKTTTGRPNYFFKYDNKGRLTDFMGYFPQFKGFDFYQKLAYGANDVIISDSFYFSGSDTNDLMKYTQNLFVGTYDYDSKGRVIAYHYDVYFPMNPGAAPRHDDVQYNYDANGNLVNPAFTYDDKKNLLRTHPLLQFINRNYSTNNAVPAISYNNFGFPLSFDFTQPHPYSGGRFMNTGVTNVVYSCTR